MSDKLQIHSNRLVRWFLITAGFFFVLLGIIGLFLPIMPTTVFLLIAAACFARSSDKFYIWLLNNKHFGKLIRDYREHRGMPLRAKFIAIIMLNLFIGYSAIFAVELVWVKILLLAIAIGVTTYIISIKTLRPNRIQEEF